MEPIYKITEVLIFLVVLAACGNHANPYVKEPVATANPVDTGMADKGIGKYSNVQLTHPLDESMVDNGEEVYKAKCFACHKLSDEKLVGPGWSKITERRTPEWIMNFVTNTNLMLDSDLVAQQLLVMCVARMPNQNLSDRDARDVLEFMRQNDGKK
jgi:cytochrome c